MGLLSIIKSAPSDSVASSSCARSRPFVRSLTHRPSALSRAGQGEGTRASRLMVGLDNAGKTTVVKRVNGEVHRRDLPDARV